MGSTILATVGSVLAGGVVVGDRGRRRAGQRADQPGRQPDRRDQAGHHRLRQQRLTTRRCAALPGVSLFGVLAVHPSVGEDLSQHDRERLLRVVPGERVARLASTLGQLTA